MALRAMLLSSACANFGNNFGAIMHQRHIVSLTSFDNADDWIMLDDSSASPLDLLIRKELELLAEDQGFDSVEEFLAVNPNYAHN